MAGSTAVTVPLAMANASESLSLSFLSLCEQ